MAVCAHVWGDILPQESRHRYTPENSGSKQSAIHNGAAVTTRDAYCQCCGCWRGTLGNERTPSEYVWHTLLWLREVRRVLRDDGTCWLCIGDSFSASGKSGGPGQGDRWKLYGPDHVGPRGGKWHTTPDYQDGSLFGIPWLVAHAAIADGWVVRNESVWTKAACMPESVRGTRWQHPTCSCYVRVHPLAPSHAALSLMGVSGGVKTSGLHQSGHTEPRAADPACPTCHGTGRLEEWVLRTGAWRHTRATESVFMLSKTMSYWSDSEAVKETSVAQENRGGFHKAQTLVAHPGAKNDGFGQRFQPNGSRNPRNTLHEPLSPAADLRALVHWLQAEAPEVLEAYQEAQTNPVNVLRPQASGHGLAHYASFPPTLIDPLIKASCPAQCCPVCGDGWAPIVSHERLQPAPPSGNREIRRWDTAGPGRVGEPLTSTVHGYAPTCTHYCTCGPLAPALLVPPTAPCPRCAKLQLSSWQPGLVCDPFAGTSTTAQVARALGRRSIMLDPSWTYIHDLSRERLDLTDLARWQGDEPPPPPETYDDLPLFAPAAPSGRDALARRQDVGTSHPLA
jgi:hypothetical protein